MRDTLEQAIRDNPDDPRAHAVYGDWLTERGDPRGELITTQLALEAADLPADRREALRAREVELLTANDDAWLGPLARLLRDNRPVRSAEGWAEVDNYDLVFRRGFPHTLRVERLQRPMARALRDWPDTGRLQDLAIGCVDWDHEDGEPVPEGEDPDEVLLAADLSGLRSFRIGDETDFDDYLWNEYGPDCHTSYRPLDRLIARMPQVEQLQLFCKRYDLGAVFALPLTRLRSLYVAHLGVSGSIWRGNDDSRPYAYPLHVLAANPAFAALEALRFHPHHEEWHWEHSGAERKASFLPMSVVRPLLTSPHLGTLRRLQLRLSDLGDAGVEEIVASPLFPRLVELDLRHGCITDAGVERLVSHPHTAALERLDLGGNALTDAGVARIAALGFSAEAQLDESEIAEQKYLYRGDTE